LEDVRGNDQHDARNRRARTDLHTLANFDGANGAEPGYGPLNTLTGKYLKQPVSIKSNFRSPSGQLPIRNAKANNLQNVSVDIPAGVLTVITGVAGSGKSSLIHQTFLRQNPDSIVIDQSPVGASSRSNPGTYTGIMDEVRKAFAAANKVSPSLFSFSSEGACGNCQGLGVVYTEIPAMGEVKSPCEICEGKRFKDEVLEYKLNGKSINDVLEMTVEQALEYFKIDKITSKLQAMSDVGLDYLTLGQPLSTLSGGECQRIKLASELHKPMYWTNLQPVYICPTSVTCWRSSTASWTGATRLLSSNTIQA